MVYIISIEIYDILYLYNQVITYIKGLHNHASGDHLIITQVETIYSIYII